MSKKRQVIGVLGCHRSGTSVITRGLQGLGAVVGDDLLPPVEGNNPTGFWEDRELHVLLQQIQRSAGSDWDALSYGFTAGHRFALVAAKPNLIDFFDSRASASRPYVFKNPRATLMVPVIIECLEQLDIAPSFVIAVRDPLSVAESLHQRDGLAIELGLLLWLKHTVAAVRDTAGTSRTFVSYDAFVEDPETQLRRVEEGLGVPGLALIPEDLDALRTEFLQPGLRHHAHDREELEGHPALSTPVLRAHEDLLRAAGQNGGEGSVDPELWIELAETLDERCAEWSMLDALRRENAEFERSIAAARDELERLAPERQAIERHAARMSAALEANNRALEVALGAVDERIASAQREAELRTSESSIATFELREQVRKLQDERDELDRVASRLVLERDAARAKAALGGPADRIEREKRDLENEIEKLKSSSSWRVTKPLRTVGDGVKSLRRRR